MNDAQIGPATVPLGDTPPGWRRIGTVIGNTSTGEFTFILRSYEAKVGDIVATRGEVPLGREGKRGIATIWGRIVSIGRFNPFFPAEAAQELADQNLRFLDTVLAGSRDHLEADVLILGTTFGDDAASTQLSPLTYPVKPSADVLYPRGDDVLQLLTGESGGPSGPPRLRVGSLIARDEVEVSLSARHVVSRHLAILAMTGGGKTVAARRIIRELIKLRYPLVIFDPHGDYLGLFEKRHLFKNNITVRILYPMIRVRKDNVSIIGDLIDKMGRKLTEPQQQFYLYLLNETDHGEGETAAVYIQRLIDRAANIVGSPREHRPQELAEIRGATMNAVRRSLDFVKENLLQMERNNQRLREHKRFENYEFHEMPDPADAPEAIIAPGLVSIFYLAGYDHLNQSAIVSIVLEALFAHRSTLQGLIPPFQAIIEEAHNFIPSRQEGTDETPSLPTIRKVITEGRKFGTGLILISQRPSRLDETTLAQCNSFLVLRLVNPRDKNFVRSVMENLSEADANVLQTFGPGEGIVSGQAVRFPLLVKVQFDEDLRSDAIGDEDFIAEARDWTPDPNRAASANIMRQYAKSTEAPAPSAPTPPKPKSSGKPSSPQPKRSGRRRGIQAKF
jgi:DNA helicase HerA-like ATPase